MTETIRFGLVGFGRFGGNHARAIANAEGAELAGVAAKSSDSIAAAAMEFPDVFITSDFHELIARDDIDVIDVALPTYLHFEVAKAALEAGKHVFIEKPMTPSTEECRELVRLAKERDLVIAIGFKRRAARLWGQVNELVNDGVIGEPQHALFELWRWPYRQGADGWRYDIRRVGSWELEEPVHCFDMARWYFTPTAGEIVSVYAKANSRQEGHPELHDNFTAILEFENGAHATIAQTLSAWGHQHGLKLTGKKGAIMATWRGATDDAPARQTLDYMCSESRQGEVESVEFTEEASELYELEREMEAFVRAIHGEGSVIADGNDGVWSIALCEAAHRSIETGEVVSMKGFKP
ncbi:MAG: Gfo/Idh/MocA family oxidoreductase [Verrucomicrobia bacterium]|nr:Gfo/Idh/MocA family oxidoreductase [Verrucomicrobiota bacterium]MDA1068876.1 Gfo/Idh/MocA family oxidoreductase [Verrucomicrobiota bacterium]